MHATAGGRGQPCHLGAAGRLPPVVLAPDVLCPAAVAAAAAPPPPCAGELTGENIEVGIVGEDRKFRVLTPAEVADYLREVE